MADAGEIKAKVTIEYDGSGVEKAKEDLASLADAGGTVEGSIGGANDALAQLAEQASSTAESTKALTSGMGELPKQLDGMVTGVQEVSDALGEGQAAIESMGGSFEALQEPLGTSVAMLQEAAPPMQLIAEHAASMNEQIAPVADNFAQLGDSLSQAVPMLPQFAESMHEISASFDPAAYGLNDFAENMNVFQDALVNPEPFSMIGQHLQETGQTWQDFTSSIGEDNSAILENMAKTGSTTSHVLGGMSENAQSAGKTFTEAAGGADAFTQQFMGINDTVAETGSQLDQAGESALRWARGINEFGGIAGAISGPAEAASMSFGDVLSETFSGLSGAFGGIGMQAMMAVQMVGTAVMQAGTQIYDFAALAEGPAAHSAGTFTGTMDALTQSAQVAGEQFSESFGQQMIPTLNAMNYSLTQSGGTGGVGGVIGGFSAGLMNLGQMYTGTLLMMSGALGPGWEQFAAGGEGFINQGAAALGMQQPFQGPPPQQQAQITYEQQLAQIPQTVLQQTYQNRTQTAVNLADATNPAFLQSQDELVASQTVYQRLQASYNASHPINQTQLLQQAQETQYDLQQAQNYQYQMANQPKESIAQAIGNWFSGGGAGGFFGGIGAGLGSLWGTAGQSWNDMVGGLGQNWNDLMGLFGGGGGGTTQPFQTAGGCFVAGTRVLMADGSEKPIETLQIGEQVHTYDGAKHRHAVITDRITFHTKQTYALTFSDGTVLLTTDSHPIATTQGWKSISPESTALENPGLPVTPLTIGDAIYTVSGITCYLASIQKREIAQVYNITVDTAHTYYANNILVHNAKGFTSGGEGSENVSLSHTFTATVTWAAQNLEKSFTAAAQWAEQNLLHQATAAAQWAESNLVHMAVAAAEWEEQNLEHTATAMATWAEQGLEHMATAVATWAEQGLEHQATMVGQWAEENLNHTFYGIAQWIGQNLEHTFNAVAQWSAQNLTPSFTVNPSVTMLAEGTSNFAGGPAIVGEAGTEVVAHNGQYSLVNQATLVNLPQGASVYPMKNLSSNVAQFADGIGDGSIIPLNIGMRGSSGGMPESVNVMVYLDTQSLMAAMGLPFAQTIRVTSGMRGY